VLRNALSLTALRQHFVLSLGILTNQRTRVAEASGRDRMWIAPPLHFDGSIRANCVLTQRSRSHRVGTVAD
jgi:hypothetical protein